MLSTWSTDSGSRQASPLASSNRIAKIAFTGETTTGRLIMQYASQNLIPVTPRTRWQEPQHLLLDVLAANDDFQDKALEGSPCSRSTRARCALARRAAWCRPTSTTSSWRWRDPHQGGAPGDPLDTETMIGAQASNDQLEKILSYIEIGKSEGASVITGGERASWAGIWPAVTTCSRPSSRARTRCGSSRRRSSGPVVSVTSFTDYDDAIRIANDTLYGLGAGVWSRDGNTAYRAGRDIKAGRVWTNCYHMYPAHAAFGGYKQSGIGRENHKMMLDHYQQTKNLLVSYSNKAQGFF